MFCVIFGFDFLLYLVYFNKVKLINKKEWTVNRI